MYRQIAGGTFFLERMAGLDIKENGGENQEKKDDCCCEETGYGKVYIELVKA